MDAPPPDAAPSSRQEASETSEGEALVRYYRIDFQRCVIQRGGRPSQSATAEDR